VEARISLFITCSALKEKKRPTANPKREKKTIRRAHSLLDRFAAKSDNPLKIG
jgi:hypothetical protein